MTREQAIMVLCDIRTYANEKQLTALEMAITLMERASDDDFPEAEE